MWTRTSTLGVIRGLCPSAPTVSATPPTPLPRPQDEGLVCLSPRRDVGSSPPEERWRTSRRVHYGGSGVGRVLVWRGVHDCGCTGGGSAQGGPPRRAGGPVNGHPGNSESGIPGCTGTDISPPKRVPSTTGDCMRHWGSSSRVPGKDDPGETNRPPASGVGGRGVWDTKKYRGPLE